ncbi:putative transposase [Nitrococcus mobilis Nb-231]|uniref:Putative transposase n=1 Tax=Nitrococcus mobilis Nb-231 TaxID=314278 RepID=A4BNA2_9GAMM|nr:putative transposase [Nitrococcus mobilis Nb-231]
MDLPGYVGQEFEEYLKCGRLEHGFLRVRCDSCHAEHLAAFSCKKRGFCPSCGARRMAESAALLVDEVFPEQPVRQWVLSVPFPLRILFASRPEVIGHVLGIVYRCIATHLIKKAGFSRKTSQTGAVTLIQRFGSALNLNVHFHMLFLDGVYVERSDGSLRFRWVKAPTSAELARLTQNLARRIGRFLERQDLLERDAENSYLAGDALEAGPMEQLLGSSITYRIAVGPQQGRKVFTLQTLPACEEPFDAAVGKVAGFSLHAGVAARADQRQKLERLCRYISRPAISEKRLSLTPNGNVRYQLKTPYRDGTTHVMFEPLDFIARLAALVPKPRVNLTRFHGVFAPNSEHRTRVTPGKRGKGGRHATTADPEGRTAAERRAAMTWAQRLKRVFGIDIDKSAGQPICTAVGYREAVGHRDVPDETCPTCGGAMRIIACIEDPEIIEKILAHLDAHVTEPEATRRPPCRAPPQRGLFDETG